jgi:uncharacterized protein YkwD
MWREKWYTWLPVAACALLALGCGVPISAVEQTATAESGGAQVVAASIESSSRSDNPALDFKTTAGGDPSELNALFTIEELDTPSPEVAESETPTPEPTVPATREPTVSATPERTVEVGVAEQPSADLPRDALAQLNGVRASSGLQPLTFDAALTAAAAAYARNMATRGFFSHTGLDGATPFGRIVAAGYAGGFKGEAISAGQPTAQQAINGLLGSPPHAAILLDGSAFEVGIGYYYQPGSPYTHYWVVVTGAVAKGLTVSSRGPGGDK